MSGFIAVHVGAGYHSETQRPTYKSVCRKACRAAIRLLKKNSSAVDAITEAIAVLEDSPLTNAGIGSNLTLDGLIECDAAIMNGATLDFGSVGSLYCVRNPIKVAREVLCDQYRGLSHGRVAPCTVVGKGAVQFAREHGIPICDSSELVTRHTMQVHSKFVSVLNVNNVQRRNDSVQVAEDHDSNLLDTVGAVCVDMQGNMCSGVSSGGILLKHSGRLGQAAIFGAGCWAQNGQSSAIPSIAVTVSGTGEHLIKTSLAKECYNGLVRSTVSLPDVIKMNFLDSHFMKNIEKKLAGVLSIIHYENMNELCWAHTTKTFILGYMSVNDIKPHAVISEQPPNAVVGASLISSGINVAC